MKAHPQSINHDLSLFIKSIDNLPNSTINSNKRSIKSTNKEKVDIKVNDFYLKLIDSKNLFRKNKKLIINKEKYGEKLFLEILELVKDGCITCLVKIDNNWIYTTIHIINDSLINVKFLREIREIKDLNKIFYLNLTLNKLKRKLLPKKVIKKYIAGYFEYFKEQNTKTDIKQNIAVI